jgi:hypothetical protein
MAKIQVGTPGAHAPLRGAYHSAEKFVSSKEFTVARTLTSGLVHIN